MLCWSMREPNSCLTQPINWPYLIYVFAGVHLSLWESSSFFLFSCKIWRFCLVLPFSGTGFASIGRRRISRKGTKAFQLSTFAISHLLGLAGSFVCCLLSLWRRKCDLSGSHPVPSTIYSTPPQSVVMFGVLGHFYY